MFTGRLGLKFSGQTPQARLIAREKERAEGYKGTLQSLYPAIQQGSVIGPGRQSIRPAGPCPLGLVAL
jgi:hypothetical protein